MKSVFVFPGITGCGFGSFGKSPDPEANFMPHGLAAVVESARQAGHEVELLDLRRLSGWEDFEGRVKSLSPTLFAFSSMSVDYGVASECINRIKAIDGRSVVVLGGVHASLATSDVERDPLIDYIVVGEGEIAFPRLLWSLEHGENPGRVIQGEQPDLEKLPFPNRDLFAYGEGELAHPWLPHMPAPFVSIVAGRGCPFNCSFCQPAERRVFGGKARRRSVENVITELKALRDKYSFRSLLIHDDLFTVDRRFVLDFCDSYQAEGFDQLFTCQARADIICKHEDMVGRMAEVGLSCFMIGFESGSQRVLDFIRKGTTVEENYRAAEICRKYGIKIFANYMVGIPTETDEEVRSTIRFINAIKPDHPSPAFYTPHPGSDLYEYCEKHDLSLIKDYSSFRRNPTEAKIRGKDYGFLRYAVEESMDYLLDDQIDSLRTLVKGNPNLRPQVSALEQRKRAITALDEEYRGRMPRSEREQARNDEVSVSPCDDYDFRNVFHAVKSAVERLGGMSEFVKPGMRVLIKPNLVGKYSPESQVITHPNVVAAVAILVREAGGTPLVGDGPGGDPDVFRNYDKVLASAGLTKVCEITGAQAVDLAAQGGDLKPHSGGIVCHSIPLSNTLRHVDLIINVAKFKTHTFTKITGAVKNLFGLLPGLSKAEIHRLAPTPELFAEALVDIYTLARPELSILDAVWSMEGDGPTAGRPSQTGFVAAGRNAAALDMAACRMVGVDPLSIATFAIAVERKLVSPEPRLIGEHDSIPRIRDFQMPLSGFDNAGWVNSYVSLQPEVDHSKCSGCSFCSHSCPVRAISVEVDETGRKKAVIDHSICIKCLCCHELCPIGAVKLNKPLVRSMDAAGVC